MIDIEFPVSFVSCSCSKKVTPEGSRTFYFLNLLSDDGNINRFFVDQIVFDQASSFLLGDRLIASSSLYFSPKTAAWAVKINSLTPSV